MATVEEKTEIGSYFISNYPPYSFWKPEFLDEAERVLQNPPRSGVPLGLYLHIPFCRKRCKFCYFRVYTDKAARDIETYIDALGREVELYSDMPVARDRQLDFVYFGGGTPSHLSTRQLDRLVRRLDAAMPWRHAQEVTFECEPGTLSESKIKALRRLGITRISLGIENYNDAILEENGRAHLSAEIFRAYDWIQQADFPQVNIDLIAGMVGETWENWRQCVRQAIEMAPDSVTIYQMELPYNTVFSQSVLHDGKPVPVADWKTKRAWVGHAFDELEAAGYEVSSAYTVVRSCAEVAFRYRDSLWHGSDLIATGVASFSHVSGVHFQNVDDWQRYLEMIERAALPLGRALKPTRRQLLIRELILQLKTGRVQADYFRGKFGVDILREFSLPLAKWQQDGMLRVSGDGIQLSRRGLLRADMLLPEFFEAEHCGVRYT